jgi:hypothetical protein
MSVFQFEAAVGDGMAMDYISAGAVIKGAL